MPRKVSRYAPRAPEVIPAIRPWPNRSVSFTVMAHPKRGAWAEELAEQIGATVTWDEKNDRHDTGLRAIKAHGPDATHHCVVQDDVVLHKDFRAAVEKLVSFPDPDAPVGLYYGSKGSTQGAHASAHDWAVRKGATWLVRKGPIWGPGIVYPVSTVPNLVEYFEASRVENYDRRVMRFYQSIGQDCWYTVPSLVEHRVDNNPSLCGHNQPGRQARMFLGPRSALEVDWTGPVVRGDM